jgi:mono/diheme cytochrome c family protein
MVLRRRGAAAALVAAALLAAAFLRAAMADERAAAAASVWDGVYMTAQAERGAAIYPAPCGKCHGHKLNGAPDDPDMFSTQPVAGSKFLRNWDGRTLGSLFEYMRATMPENNPSFLSDREYADLVAYMLFVSGVPTGDAELSSDPGELAGIVIRRQR